MIILGLILLLVGWLTWRPLALIGAALAIIGLIFYIADVAGPVHAHWY